MVKEGFKSRSKDVAWLALAASVWAGTAVVKIGKAYPFDAGPAMQTAAGAKASAPATKAAPKEAAKPARAKKTASKQTVKKPSTAAVPVPKAPEIEGRRDPFKLPGPPVQGGLAQGPGEVPLGPLPPGSRGLVISQLRVEGVVRLDTTNSMIAVVDNNSNRAYFLRENDAVYNGVVAKITPDSVVFKENALDQSGKMFTREVVKRIGQGPGA